jgi:phospholipase/carboxylesterase
VKSEATRRSFTRSLGGGIAFSALADLLRSQTRRPQGGGAANRLRARAVAPVKSPVPAGLHSLNVRDQRDTQVYIPEAAAKFTKAPLVLSLHGATQGADRGISLLRAQADEFGFVLLAPASADTTWEIEENWGADRDNIDQSLALSFGLRDIDPARIAVAGFSDGASYSLSLGLCNGDLFNVVLGFSAGYIVNGPRTGKPPVFLSHGTDDPIFPINVTGRLLERTLKDNGYAVTFRQFEGRHTLPSDVASEAMRWMMAAPPLAV